MINAALELGRSRGFKVVAGKTIVSGNFVKLVANGEGTTDVPFDTVNPLIDIVTGEETEATASIFGIAADDNTKIPAEKTAALGFDVIDNWYKNHLVAAYLKGGLFSVWNDGRGAVFADTVIGAAVGTPLYVTAGKLTTEAGTADTLGAVKVGSVIRAPLNAAHVTAGTTAGYPVSGSANVTGQNGVLYFKADI